MAMTAQERRFLNSWISKWIGNATSTKTNNLLIGKSCRGLDKTLLKLWHLRRLVANTDHLTDNEIDMLYWRMQALCNISVSD